MNKTLAIVCHKATAQSDWSPLAEHLQAEGYDVAWFNLDTTSHDLAQADFLILPIQVDNYRPQLDWCAQLKATGHVASKPILLLTELPNVIGHPHASSALSSGATTQVVADPTTMLQILLEGLHAGATDYVKAPYTMMELVGKIQSTFRHQAAIKQTQATSDQLNHLNEELTQRNLQVEKELYIARQLQQSLLPKAIVRPDENNPDAPLVTCVIYQSDKLRISGIYLPCDALGGDLYDVIPLANGGLGISITDVSGHGVPAGFITAILKTAFYRATAQHIEPSGVLHQLNNELYELIKTGDYVTGVYLYVDPTFTQVMCSGAGHPYPFYYKASDQSFTRLEKNSMPLVWVPGVEYPQEALTLSPGDKLYLFTDGVSELRNTQGELFGEERIEHALRVAIDAQSPYINDDLITVLSDFTQGEPLGDDLTMVLVEAL